jgi:hypothetical protein
MTNDRDNVTNNLTPDATSFSPNEVWRGWALRKYGTNSFVLYTSNDNEGGSVGYMLCYLPENRIELLNLIAAIAEHLVEEDVKASVAAGPPPAPTRST